MPGGGSTGAIPFSRNCRRAAGDFSKLSISMPRNISGALPVELKRLIDVADRKRNVIHTDEAEASVGGNFAVSDPSVTVARLRLSCGNRGR